MSDSGEKHFEATASRIAKAKREGNVARSLDIASNAALAGALLAVFAMLPPFAAQAQGVLVAGATGSVQGVRIVPLLAWSLTPMLAGAVCAVAVGVAQVGGLRFVAPTLKFERLNPIEGFKRMFSRETLAQLLRGGVACSLACAALFPGLRRLLGVAGSGAAPTVIAMVAWQGIGIVLASVLAVGVSFALLDYGIVRRSWLRKLRMSFEEYKRDMKDQEGDAFARGRRRALHRAHARGNISRVKEAAFVVANPTHIAVALAYAPPSIPVPRVLVRAIEEQALAVRELARACRIPVIEDVTLARSLYAACRVGDEIAAEHFVAVAQIVAELTRTGALRS